MTAVHGQQPLTVPGRASRSLAAVSLAVLVLGALLFATAWLIGGDDATSDNWVGFTVVVALFTGLVGSFTACVVAVFTALRRHTWRRLLLPLLTFPAVVLTVALLEAFVFE